MWLKNVTWNVVVIAFTHFECCMSEFVDLYTPRLLKTEINFENYKSLVHLIHKDTFDHFGCMDVIFNIRHNFASQIMYEIFS